jgi:hypothetical protein
MGNPARSLFVPGELVASKQLSTAAPKRTLRRAKATLRLERGSIMTRSTQCVLAIASLTVILLVVAQTTRKAEAADTTDSPVGFALCTPEGSAAAEKCGIFGLPPSYQVPAGRRLIIEQVSGDCADDGQPGEPLRAGIVAQTQGAVLKHAIIGVPNAESPGGRIPLTLTRIYADGNSTVTIDVVEVPAFSARLCKLTFSGLLTK